MSLDELLAEVDGIGGDTFIPSPALRAAVESPAVTAPVKAAPSKPPVTIDEPADASLERVFDVEFELTVELGTVELSLNELLALAPGDCLAPEQGPQDLLRIFVNDRLVAHGEAVIVDGARAVKIVEILAAPVS